MAWTQLGPAGEPAPATSTADDMAAMRARWAEAHGRSPDLPSDVAVLWAEVGRLRAEVDQLRADLAAAQRITEAHRSHVSHCPVCVAHLSAGGTDPTGDKR